MHKVLVPLAEGCEELEAVTVIDLLRRAGIDVTVAGLKAGVVKASRGVMLQPDLTLDEALQQDYDMIVLPGGGPGSERLAADNRIRDILVSMADKNKFTAAICAAPKVLLSAGLLQGKKASCYPGVLQQADLPGLDTTQAVIKDGKVITSRGPGTAIDFALQLIESLLGRDRRDTVEAELVRT
jgi:4-methyl-5(b-hydroxyethyl)-thiazole monophosphate biosynthesis